MIKKKIKLVKCANCIIANLFEKLWLPHNKTSRQGLLGSAYRRRSLSLWFVSSESAFLQPKRIPAYMPLTIINHVSAKHYRSEKEKPCSTVLTAGSPLRISFMGRYRPWCNTLIKILPVSGLMIQYSRTPERS